MEDARRVREVKTGADILEDAQPIGDRQRRAPTDQLCERLAGHVLHRDERPVLVLADIEDRDDVGMAQAAGGARLAREALARRLVVESLLEQFDGDQRGRWRDRGRDRASPCRRGQSAGRRDSGRS